MEAFNRRDLDAAVSPGHPDFEFAPAARVRRGGFFEPCYRGPAGFRKYVSTWSEVWGADLRVEPVELIDLGDRVVLLADAPARAQASGVPFTGKHRDSLRAEGREGDPRAGLLGPRRSPRSRGAVGVGDVAGERGGGAVANDAVQRRDEESTLHLCDEDIRWGASGFALPDVAAEIGDSTAWASFGWPGSLFGEGLAFDCSRS